MDELRSALELATEEELAELTEILFRPKFNPLDYVQKVDPLDIQSRDRESWLDAIEQRFRYLAADGLTVLRGKTQVFTYRQALIRVCQYLKIRYSQSLSTTDLEAEIFLFLMGKAWKQLPKSEQKALNSQIQRSLQSSTLAQPLPVQLQKNPMGLLVKGGSALAVSSIVQPFLLQQIARQFAIQFAKYQLAQQALLESSAIAATQFQTYITLQTAKRGMVVSSARYTAVRGIFAFVGPLLWTWFLADLGWRAIATNYGRIIPTIFTLAQIRLTRDECWEIA